MRWLRRWHSPVWGCLQSAMKLEWVVSCLFSTRGAYCKEKQKPFKKEKDLLPAPGGRLDRALVRLGSLCTQKNFGERLKEAQRKSYGWSHCCREGRRCRRCWIEWRSRFSLVFRGANCVWIRCIVEKVQSGRLVGVRVDEHYVLRIWGLLWTHVFCRTSGTKKICSIIINFEVFKVFTVALVRIYDIAQDVR